MKKVWIGFAAMAVLTCAGSAWAQAINKTCPVKGTPVKPNIIAQYEGKVIGFC